MLGLKQFARRASDTGPLGPKTKAQVQAGEMIGALLPPVPFKPGLTDHLSDKVAVSPIIRRRILEGQSN